ncbi:unnamed protein product, partial [Cuscuta campestris]
VEEVAAGRELKGMRHSSEPDYYYEDYLMSIVRRIYSRICPKPATAFLYLSSSSRDEEGERCAGRENVPGMSRIHSTLQKLVLGGEEKVPDAYKFIGIDLSGMHCAILLIDKRVVSSVIFRVVGTDLAEVPLAATSAQAEGQGYFQALFCCLKKLLGSLAVKNVVVSALKEAEPMWIK